MAGENFEEILQHLQFVECDCWLFVCLKLAGVGLNVCECAGKVKSP